MLQMIKTISNIIIKYLNQTGHYINQFTNPLYISKCLPSTPIGPRVNKTPTFFEFDWWIIDLLYAEISINILIPINQSQCQLLKLILNDGNHIELGNYILKFGKNVGMHLRMIESKT